jgi:hypothetical protein
LVGVEAVDDALDALPDPGERVGQQLGRSHAFDGRSAGASPLRCGDARRWSVEAQGLGAPGHDEHG